MKQTLLVGAKGFVGKAILGMKPDNKNRFTIFDTRNDKLTQILLETHGAIVWCAGKTNPLSASSFPELPESEFLTWKDFIDLLCKFNYSGTVIFLSSGGCVYSGSVSPFSETDPAFGINEYGRLKIRMENFLIHSGLRFKILRLSNLYGPGQVAGKGQGVVAEWISQLKHSNYIKVIGSTSSFRDYLNISDLVRAIEESVSTDAQPGIYNIGSGIETSISELIAIFKSCTERNFGIIEAPARHFDRLGYSLNTRKFNTSHAWSPKIDILAGIRSQIILAGKNE